MKRIISLLVLGVILSGASFADTFHASAVPVRHHVKHHAHKAGKHHTPKHRQKSI